MPATSITSHEFRVRKDNLRQGKVFTSALPARATLPGQDGVALREEGFGVRVSALSRQATTEQASSFGGAPIVRGERPRAQ